MMNKVEFNEALCKSCGGSLFLDKDECKGFIEGRLKEGYIVCICCGSKEKPENN